MSEPAGNRPTVGMITGLFGNRETAERAYRCVTDLGYRHAEINVVMADETRQRHFADQPSGSGLTAKAAASADAQSQTGKELGGPMGGTIGTAAPVLAAIGTLVLIPGIGLAVAGPALVALTAAAAVGLAGGIIGAFTDWGVPRSRMEEYESGIRAGGILLGVRPRSTQDAERIVQCWQTSGGRSVHS